MGASHLRFWRFVAGQSTSCCGLNRRLSQAWPAQRRTYPAAVEVIRTRFMSRRAKACASLIAPCRIFAGKHSAISIFGYAHITRVWSVCCGQRLAGQAMQVGGSEFGPRQMPVVEQDGRRAGHTWAPRSCPTPASSTSPPSLTGTAAPMSTYSPKACAERLTS